MRRTVLLSAALLITVSCGEAPAAPTNDNPQRPGPEIVVSEITPGSGATLAFGGCGIGGLCTEQLQTTFDVLVFGDMPEAIVVVSLRQGSTPCAMAHVATALSAGARTPFKMSSVFMVHDEEGQLLCPMPADTTSLAIEVYFRYSPAHPVLSRVIPNSYRLAMQ